MKFKSDSFLGSGYKHFDLKFIFDNLRNIGISAAIAVAGITLQSNTEFNFFSEFRLDTDLIGLLFLILSGLLLTLNFIQYIYISASSDSSLRSSIAILSSIPVYITTFYLFIAYIFQSTNVMPS